MKTNLYLFAIAVVLLIPCLYRGCQGSADFVDESPALFEGFIPDNASFIRIGKPDLKQKEEVEKKAKAQGEKGAVDPVFSPDQVTDLVLESGKWKVQVNTQYGPLNLAAVQSKIEELLTNIKEIPRNQADIVTEDDKDHAKYEVDTWHATHVFVLGKNKKKLAHLLIGRKPKPGEGADWTASQGLFVRQNGQPFVVHYSKSYWNVDVTNDTWLDKKVLTFERDKVKRIVVNNPKGGWTVEKGGEDKKTWSLTAPIKGKAKMEHVNNLLHLSNLYMDAFVAPNVPQEVAKAGLDANTRYTVTLEMEDGKVKHVLRVGVGNPDKEGQVLALVEGQKFIFSVGKHLTESMRKPAADVKEEPKDKAKPAAPVEDKAKPKTPPKPAGTAPGPKPDGTMPKPAPKEEGDADVAPKAAKPGTPDAKGAKNDDAKKAGQEPKKEAPKPAQSPK